MSVQYSYKSSFHWSFLAAIVMALIGLDRQQRVQADQITTLDCAIVGAGPAGITASLGLRKVLGPNAKIAIFERTGSFRRVGGQVGLMQVGLNALHAIDPEIAAGVRARSFERKLFRMHDETGQVQKEMVFEPGKNASVVIPWFDLQQSLLECLPNDVVIYLDHEIAELGEDESTGMVLLTFENGKRYKSRFVVGADGNLSRVRSLLFGGETPEFSSSVVWRMFIPVPMDEEEIPENSRRMGESNVWTGNGKTLALQRFADDRLYLSGLSGWPKEELHLLDRKRYIGTEDSGDSGGTTPNELRLERFVTALSGFDTKIMQFIRTHCHRASILEHPVYFRPTGRPWGKGRITMIGDAAHMMPPNSAMGTPMAFEDAVELAHSVHQLGLTVEALRRYETTRQPRVDRIAGEAISRTFAYYRDKDYNAHPFQMNSPKLFDFIHNFRQEPVVSYTKAAKEVNSEL